MDSEERKTGTSGASLAVSGIGEYKASTDWQEYVERFEFSCFAQGIIEDERKKALLLASVGQEMYTTVKSVLSPVSPARLPYTELLNKVSLHFAPKRSVILCRFKFNQCVQEPGQLTADYLTKLKRLAENCDIGPTLNDMLRDRLVCGIRDSALQKRLLAEEDSLTFVVAEKMSLAAESVSRDVSQLAAGRVSGEPAPEAVHRAGQLTADRPYRPVDTGSRSVGQGRGGSAAGPRRAGGPGQVTGRRSAPADLMDGRRREPHQDCYRCGGRHSAHNCRFREYRCHTCGQLGHLRRRCVRGADSMAAQAVNEATVPDDDCEDELDVCGIYTVGRPKCPPITVEMLVFGVPVQFEVDTGTASTLMSTETFRDVSANGGHGGLTLSRSDARLRSYTGNVIPVVGEFSAVVKYDSQHLDLPVLVVESNGPNLLGRDWLVTLKLDWRGIQQVRALGESASSVVTQLKPSIGMCSRRNWDALRVLKSRLMWTRRWLRGS